jgi:dTDP-4-amino-4,6-dideoxygalactose transaminase
MRQLDDPEVVRSLDDAPTARSYLPLIRPDLRDRERIKEEIASILEGDVLTNGPRVRLLEERARSYLGVRNCVAVSSCTVGLMLVLRAADLTGDVILPSFSFSATAHAVAWNGIRPVFADIEAGTLTLSPEDVRRVAGPRTSAILATHIFGTPCDIESLERVASEGGIRLIFDAAHAFGSMRGDRMIGGFGDAEVFSLSPTKVFVAGEGGLITTNDDHLAERCRIGRDYGNPGDYDCEFVGLNGRMSEFHAAIALASLDSLEERLAERGRLASLYRRLLDGVPGISFAALRAGDRTTYKDFTILVDPSRFGMTADELSAHLETEGIDTRRYYSPPIHRMRAYCVPGRPEPDLPVTDAAAVRTLTLPLWTGMAPHQIERVADVIRQARDRVKETA